MDSPEFNDIVDRALARVQEVLVLKGDEYVPEGEPSRFHNFETAAAFNHQRSTEALWGFLTKHLVSLSDMVKVDSTEYPLAQWDEKITDALVYLVLLYGIVNENDKLALEKQTIKQETIGVEAQRRAPSIVLHTENP
ncbi:hypothetical protein SEA_CONLEY_52 [Gordonia phage Conley]|nr:hypothetical protein SEA_CONLEY_52 [Gordonia phage Conley]